MRSLRRKVGVSLDVPLNFPTPLRDQDLDSMAKKTTKAKKNPAATPVRGLYELEVMLLSGPMLDSFCPEKRRGF